jgi:hypothetical protein
MFFSAAARAYFLFFLMFASVCRAGASTALDYQVIYRGVFSAGADMPIADLLLEAPLRTDSSAIWQAGLSASSAAYPLVESVFPIRYRFRSWTGPEPADLLGFEIYESTRKVRHRLYLRDDSISQMKRFDLTEGVGQQEMAQLEAGVSPVAADQRKGLLDRLGLLQLVRQQDLHEQARYRFEVTNGRERLVYLVKVETAQILDIGGLAVPAWKLRFDGLEHGRNGTQVAAHRPVYVWLSRVSDHVPLRLDSRQAIGLFRVELKTRSTLRQLVQAST